MGDPKTFDLGTLIDKIIEVKKLIKIPVVQMNDYGEWLFWDEDKSFFIMGNHKYALYCWMIFHEKINQLNDAALYHIDYHFDYAVDDWINVFLENPTSSEAMSQANNFNCYTPPRYRICEDNFIPAAVGAGLFKKGVFICKDNHHDLDKSIRGRLFDHKIFGTFDEFKEEFSKQCSSQNICLDIDLDYFNNSDKWYGMDLLDEDTICNCLQYLKSLPNVEITTIALSEPFSGGKVAAPKLLGLVKDIWGISENIEEAVQCPY